MLKKISKALAAVGFVACAGTAGAGVDFTFTTANIPGSTTAFSFTADEITITSLGGALITVTDNGDGAITPAFLDGYFELGVVAAVNFQNNNLNIPIATSGVNLGYELLATYTLAGPVGVVGTNAVAPVFFASATITYDETVDNMVTAGATTVATLGVPVGGDCTFTSLSSFSDGACKITMAMSAVAGAATGIWNVNGVNLASLLGASMTLDINVDNLVPLSGVPLPGLVPGVDNLFTADHDGSAVINIPEPGVLALLGIALGAFGVSRRRKA